MRANSTWGDRVLVPVFIVALLVLVALPTPGSPPADHQTSLRTAEVSPYFNSFASVGSYATSATTSSFTTLKGDTVFVFVGIRGSSNVTSVKDKSSNDKYVFLHYKAVSFSGVSEGLAIWRAINASASTSNSVTVKLAAKESFNALVVDISGLSTSSPMVTVNSSFASGTSSGISATVTATSGALLLLAAGVQDYTTFLSYSVQSELKNSQGGNESSVGYGEGASSNSTYDMVTETSGGTHGWVAMALAFETVASEMAAQETADCLAPVGTNSTLHVNSTKTEVTTNLTAWYGDLNNCNLDHQKRTGLATETFTNAQIDNAWVFEEVNTTGIMFNNYTYNLYSSQIATLGNYTPLKCGPNEFLNITKGSNPQYTVSFYTLSNGACVVEYQGTGGGGSSGGGSGGCPTGGSSPEIYVWDSICFEKNGPTAYPHPDLSYYNIVQTEDWHMDGAQLFHAQLGTNTVGLLQGLGPVAVGTFIGAALGEMVSDSPIGAGAGAVLGLIIGVIMQYELNVQFNSETGAWWFWVNLGFVTAMENVPWYVIAFGPAAVALYLAPYLTELRVGNTWFENKLDISGP